MKVDHFSRKNGINVLLKTWKSVFGVFVLLNNFYLINYLDIFRF